MSFSLPAHWVWDFWIADDGDLFHLYYLHAPTSLGHESLRHRNARIGHATSPDLRTWTDLGPVLGPGGPGDVDETATWTGSVVRDDDGVWRMFYTGSRFLAPDAMPNIETVAVATSTDLHTWTKHPELSLSADAGLYEVLGDGTWREEAWRDPWVFRGEDGRWHMLVTARARAGEGDDRGVVGHAVSDDLATWTVGPALSEAGAGFGHLEVLQIVEVDGVRTLLFSCDAATLAGSRRGGMGGIWAVAAESETGPFAIDDAQLVVDEALYAGRVVHDRAGRPLLLAFDNTGEGADFAGGIADPLPLSWDADGRLVAAAPVTA